VELFVASLASCVAFYAGRYLTRHGYDRDGLTVSAGFAMASDGPARVTEMWLTVRVPDGLPAERRRALRAVVTRCTVHNTLVSEPSVTIDIRDRDGKGPGEVARAASVYFARELDRRSPH
jgi:putative redox protein